jgi:hypothetical protein
MKPGYLYYVERKENPDDPVRLCAICKTPEGLLHRGVYHQGAPDNIPELMDSLNGAIEMAESQGGTVPFTDEEINNVLLGLP